MINPQSDQPNDSVQSKYRYIIAQIPFIVIIIGLLVSLLVISFGHWRRGTTLMGVLSLIAAIFRLVLPESSSGLLQVRGKLFDTVWYFIVGAVIVLMSLTIDAVPGA